MIPEKKETQIQLFELSNDPQIKARQDMLMIPQVVEKMTATELMVANASAKTPLKEIPNKELAGMVIALGKNILRDIGFRDWNEPQANEYRLIRFTDVLTKYFKTLTLSDIKLAFEFMAVGLLDDYLSKDKNGNPEKSHYNDFSIEYYSKVLNAYKTYRAQIWFKAQSNVPKLADTIPEEQRKQNSNCIIQEIYDSFDDFKNSKKEPNFDIHVFARVLIEAELIENKPIEEESIRKAYKYLLANNLIQGVARKRMIDKYAERKMTHVLRMNAWNVQNNKTIKEYFEKLIEEKKDIRDYLNKIE